MRPSVKTWAGWEVHLTERIETRQFIFIFDEVKLGFKKKKNPVVTKVYFTDKHTKVHWF